MSREAYLRGQQVADPRYDTDRAVARTQLRLAAALYERRILLGYTLEHVAERSGLPAERIEMIEEGDTSSLPEILDICHVLDLSLTLEPLDSIRTLPTTGERSAEPARISSGVGH